MLQVSMILLSRLELAAPLVWYSSLPLAFLRLMLVILELYCVAKDMQYPCHTITSPRTIYKGSVF
jgi:hypothetical protein